VLLLSKQAGNQWGGLGMGWRWADVTISDGGVCPNWGVLRKAVGEKGTSHSLSS